MGDNGDWVPSKLQSGNFVNYLPQDEAVAAGLGVNEGGLDPVESQRVVDLLNRELSRLLTLNPREFWREVATDTSLHDFLESFLKFRSRWYDFPYRGAKGIVAGVIVGEFELSRRVFMVLYRISSNRDPSAKAADSLSPNNHAVILQEKKLLDLPKLLDICAIYSHENEDLTRLMVVNAIKAQPGIHDNFTPIMSHFLNIVNTTYQRCSTSLEVLLSSRNPPDSGSSRLHADYLEVMDFINDAIVSMDAFVSAYKHAAIFFSCPVETSYGNEELVKTLAKLNDMLLPSLQQGFRIIFGAGDGHMDTFPDMFYIIAISLKMLSSRIVNLGWKLLYFCYLNDEVFEESIPLPGAIKILPAQVEDPVIRADIVVQTFREISVEFATVQEGKSRGTFLQTVDKNHRLMSRIELLQNKGWISLDDEQMQFLSGIIVHPRSKEISDFPVVTSNKVQIDEDTAIIESKISQIKDLFPDYGKGFLSACLEVYNQNPEEVIQRILEGTLHKDLLLLDTSLEVVPPKSASSVSRKDKGKGKLIESASTTAPSTNMVPLVSKLQIDGPPSSSSSSAGRYVRKSTGDSADSEILDTRNEKDVAKTAALALQLEYEDEYDDSFDDLGLSVGDSGLEDREINSNGENSWESGSGSSPSNASRWGSRQKPQFFVKDGKNYSYKVAGSVAAANYNEASIVNHAQKELIHGLGRGGNLPLGAVKKMERLNEVKEKVMSLMWEDAEIP